MRRLDACPRALRILDSFLYLLRSWGFSHIFTWTDGPWVLASFNRRL
jgi:hypothetical protein